MISWGSSWWEPLQTFSEKHSNVFFWGIHTKQVGVRCLSQYCWSILFGFNQSFCPAAPLGSGALSHTQSSWASLPTCCKYKSGSSHTSPTRLSQQLGSSAKETQCDLQHNYSPCHPSIGAPTTWCWGAGLTPHVPSLLGTHIGSPRWTS